MSDTCYYNAFDQLDAANNSNMFPDIIVKRISGNEKKNVMSQVKFNRYPNIQNPGNLWYHDHAMRLTQYNVQYGLTGIYILRDPAIES